MAEGPAHHGSHEDHGGSVAAWTGVFALLVSSALIAVGIYFGLDLITIGGIVVGVIGLVVAVILAKAGFGVDAKRRQLSQARASDGRTGTGHA